MILQILTFAIPNILILLNLNCFLKFEFENIINIVFILILMSILYYFIFKYKQPEHINNVENQKIVSYLTFFLFPLLTMMSVYLYPGNIIINYLIILAIQGIFFIIFRNVKVATIMQLIFSFIFIFITENSIVLRGMPFLPVDLLSVKLGMTLLSNYNIVITSGIIRAFVAAYLLGYIAIKVNVKKASTKENFFNMYFFNGFTIIDHILY